MANYYSIKKNKDGSVVIESNNPNAKQTIWSWAGDYGSTHDEGAIQLYGTDTGYGGQGDRARWRWHLTSAGIASLTKSLRLQLTDPKRFDATPAENACARELLKKLGSSGGKRRHGKPPRKAGKRKVGTGRRPRRAMGGKKRHGTKLRLKWKRTTTKAFYKRPEFRAWYQMPYEMNVVAYAHGPTGNVYVIYRDHNRQYDGKEHGFDGITLHHWGPLSSEHRAKEIVEGNASTLWAEGGVWLGGKKRHSGGTARWKSGGKGEWYLGDLQRGASASIVLMGPDSYAIDSLWCGNLTSHVDIHDVSLQAAKTKGENMRRTTEMAFGDDDVAGLAAEVSKALKK